MSIISDKQIDHVYCVKFENEAGKSYYAYYQNLENAQKNAHIMLLDKRFTKVTIKRFYITCDHDDIDLEGE